MTYFVDFDRTLFNFEAFFLHLAELPDLLPLKDRILTEAERIHGHFVAPERAQLANDINTLYAAGGFSFTPNSLAPFVYPDALTFLKTHGSESIVVTAGSGDLSFQKGKVIASGVESLVKKTTFVSRGEPKGPAVATLLSKYNAPYCFIDDFAEQIDSVTALCPEVVGYEMRRDGESGCGRYTVIRSFNELP